MKMVTKAIWFSWPKIAKRGQLVANGEFLLAINSKRILFLYLWRRHICINFKDPQRVQTFENELEKIRHGSLSFRKWNDCSWESKRQTDEYRIFLNFIMKQSVSFFGGGLYLMVSKKKIHFHSIRMMVTFSLGMAKIW